MSKLRHSIRFMQYAQKNPLQLYVLEADRLFKKYKTEVKMMTVRLMINLTHILEPEKFVEEREVKTLVL